MSETMTSNPKPTATNTLGKRKKSRENRGSYLSKWLDKTMQHIQESTPSMDTYDTLNYNPNYNTAAWATNPNFFVPPDYRVNPYGFAAEPMSLPAYPSTYNPNFFSNYPPNDRLVPSANKSIQVHRPRQKKKDSKKEPESPNRTFNNTSYIQTSKPFSDSQDFASLPPIVTSVGDTASNSADTVEKDESNTRRFSDPCVGGLPDVARDAGDQDDDSGSESSGNDVGNKLLMCLVDQITSLKMTNERLNKELLETKAELQSSRHHTALWHKGPGSNLGAHNATHSSLNNNGVGVGVGAGGGYSPGAIAELVREIKEAARVREEALYSRVRAMLHERGDLNGLALNDSGSKVEHKIIEDLKRRKMASNSRSELRMSEADNRRMNERLTKLEDELYQLRIASGLSESSSAADVETLRLRRELMEMRRAKQMAEDHSLKLERLVTQMRSKLNGLATANGPESLPSETETEHRRTRTSSLSSGAATAAPTATLPAPTAPSTNGSPRAAVVFGPVTDL